VDAVFCIALHMHIPYIHASINVIESAEGVDITQPKHLFLLHL
jgi:hypothetical protein